jgi:hypothetical protein
LYAALLSLRLEKKLKMDSQIATTPQSIHNTSTHDVKHEFSETNPNLKRKADSSVSNYNGSVGNADLDLTTYDLKAHSLLCADLLNGEGVDRMPGETDTDLTSRLWASWNECKLFCQWHMCHEQSSDTKSR